MYLFFDTSGQQSHRISLVSQEGVSKQEVIVEADLEVSLLPAIDALLIDEGVSMSTVKGIIVVSGPGGFTSLRIGLSVANAFGWALGIPVVGVEKKEGATTKEEYVQEGLQKIPQNFQPVMPQYGREPNITKSRA